MASSRAAPDTHKPGSDFRRWVTVTSYSITFEKAFGLNQAFSPEHVGSRPGHFLYRAVLGTVGC